MSKKCKHYWKLFEDDDVKKEQVRCVNCNISFINANKKKQKKHSKKKV